jgi:hypothetical protein
MRLSWEGKHFRTTLTKKGKWSLPITSLKEGHGFIKRRAKKRGKTF